MIDEAGRLLATYLANAIWQIPVIVGIALLCAKAMCRTSWAYRHMLWVAALVLSVLLPLSGLRNQVGTDVLQSTQIEIVSGARSNLAISPGPADKGNWFLGKEYSWPIALKAGLYWFLVGSYAAFLLYRLIVFGMAWWRMGKFRRRAELRSVPASFAEIAQCCAASWNINNVRVLFSSESAGPMTLGFHRPVLILPEISLGEVSEADFASAIYHELAHVRRHDYALNFISQLLYMPVSFHPAAALIKARIDQTRELACDEMAAETSSSPAAYARSLLNIAQSICSKSSERSSHALGLFDTDTLEQRIWSLLRQSDRVGVVGERVRALFGSTLLAAGCLALSPFSVQIANSTWTLGDLARFRGTWEGQSHGGPFVTLKLKEKNGRLVGTLLHSTRASDVLNGDVKVVDMETEDEVLQTRRSGTELLLTLAGRGGRQREVQYVLEPTGKHVGELRMIGPQSNGPLLEPLEIKQTSAVPHHWRHAAGGRRGTPMLSRLWHDFVGGS